MHWGQSHCYYVNDCQKTNFVSKRRYAFHVLKMNAYLLLLTNYDLLVKGGTHFFATKKVTHVSKNAYLLLLVKTYFCNHLYDNNEDCATVFLKWTDFSQNRTRQKAHFFVVVSKNVFFSALHFCYVNVIYNVPKLEFWISNIM